MKRIIFILLAALASNGWLMANHWTPNSMPYEDNMTLTGIVRIDGVEQQTAVLEMGAFCGEECRGSAQLAFFPPTQHFVVQMEVFGESGDEIVFRLYNHNLDEELEMISFDTLSFLSEGYGSLAEPYLFNFYSEYPGPHVITVSAAPVEYGTVTGGGTYDHFSTCTLTATANEDYVFVNWTKDGEVASASATYSFEVTEPGDYVAHFELGIIHHWTPNGTSFEDNMTLTGVVKIDGQEQQSPMLEVAAFCGEECRGSGILTYFAPTQRYVVQMFIYGQGGDAFVFKLYDHELNEELDVYSTEAVSFTTNGYGSLANPYVLDFTETVTETHTVSATVNPEESGTVEGTGTYINGETCTLTATPNEGYAFVNWTENGTMVSVSSSYEFEVNSDLAFVANFVPIEGNHWTPNSASYEDNMTLTGIVLINFVEQQTTALEMGVFCGEECRGAARLTFFPLTQHYVVQVVVYGESGDELTFKLYDHSLGEELDLVSPDAIAFNGNGYGSLANPYMLNFLETFDVTVSVSPAESGIATGAGVYNYGTAVTLTATPNTGYHFVNWTLGGEEISTEASYSFTVSEASAFVANFELNSYEIIATANPEEGGEVNGAGTYDHFSTCMLTATANEGYHFVNWTLSGDEVSTEASYSFVVTEASAFVANFELNSYGITATANPEEGGEVTGAGTYDHFSTCTLTATANEGYHFVNWTLSGDEVSTEASYSFTVTEASAFVANFELNSYEITATANPEEGGEVTGAGTYDYGATATLTATAAENYNFVNWTLEGKEVSTEESYSFTVTEAGNYVANFELSAITQTASLSTGWNWWSGYVELGGNDGLVMLQEALGTNGVMIKSQNDGFNSYLEGFGWYGALSAINNESMYQVRASAGCTIELTGQAIHPADHPITLGLGWNWIGFPSTVSMSVAEAFSGITPQNGDMLKSQNNGFASYLEGFGWYGQLTTLTPGMGLMYKSNNSQTVIFTFPTVTEGGGR